jgi:hypothetical protein
MLIFSLILSLRSLIFLLHPFYVSITEVKYNENSHKMEIGCRIFYDDLEEALGSERNVKIDLIKPSDRILVDSALAQYMKGHLLLKVNGKPITLTYLGYQIEDDVAWCFLESSEVTDFKNIEFRNALLFNQFKNQTNIMHIQVGKTRKSVKLDNPTSQVRMAI